MENNELKALLIQREKLKAEMKSKGKGFSGLSSNPMALMSKMGEIGGLVESFNQVSAVNDEIIAELVKREVQRSEAA